VPLRRATSATHCNAASSRSHAVLRLTCQLAPRAGDEYPATGRLTLVDCAGSERKEDNMHHSAEQRKETAEINASLYALKVGLSLLSLLSLLASLFSLSQVEFN
jgi:kinesin family protein 2/24